MLGPESAGKTTILHKINMGQPVNTIPNCGFDVETVWYQHIRFIAWDSGGGLEKIRSFWSEFV